MDLHVHNPVVTRGRILLLALLAAIAWMALSVLGSSTPAVADDSSDSGGSLLDTITATVDDLSPVPTVTAPVTAVVDEVVEPLKPAVEPVTQHAVVVPVTRVAETTLRTAATVTGGVIDRVLDQPVIAETVELLNGVVDDSIDVLPMTPAEATPSALAANGPEPAAVGSTGAAPDTRAAPVPAAGSLPVPDDPSAPATPVAPAFAPSSALSQSSGAPSLLAAVPAAGQSVALTSASAAWVNFALPSSPTFDSDTSPD